MATPVLFWTLLLGVPALAGPQWTEEELEPYRQRTAKYEAFDAKWAKADVIERWQMFRALEELAPSEELTLITASPIYMPPSSIRCDDMSHRWATELMVGFDLELRSALADGRYATAGEIGLHYLEATGRYDPDLVDEHGEYVLPARVGSFDDRLNPPDPQETEDLALHAVALYTAHFPVFQIVSSDGFVSSMMGYQSQYQGATALVVDSDMKPMGTMMKYLWKPLRFVMDTDWLDSWIRTADSRGAPVVFVTVGDRVEGYSSKEGRARQVHRPSPEFQKYEAKWDAVHAEREEIVEAYGLLDNYRCVPGPNRDTTTFTKTHVIDRGGTYVRASLLKDATHVQITSQTIERYSPPICEVKDQEAADAYEAAMKENLRRRGDLHMPPRYLTTHFQGIEGITKGQVSVTVDVGKHQTVRELDYAGFGKSESGEEALNSRGDARRTLSAKSMVLAWEYAVPLLIEDGPPWLDDLPDSVTAEQRAHEREAYARGFLGVSIEGAWAEPGLGDAYRMIPDLVSEYLPAKALDHADALEYCHRNVDSRDAYLLSLKERKRAKEELGYEDCRGFLRRETLPQTTDGSGTISGE